MAFFRTADLPSTADLTGRVRSAELKALAMHDDGRDDQRRGSGAPVFVLSCAAGFLIISGCVVYFIVKFFL